MHNLTTTSHTTTTSTKNKIKRNFRGATVMTKLTKVCNTGIRCPIDFYLQSGKCYSEKATAFESYTKLLSRRKIEHFVR